MAVEGANMGPAVPVAVPTIMTRFSTLRFNKVIKKLKPVQIAFVKKYGFHIFLNLPDHFRPPPAIIQWLLDNTSISRRGVFEKKSKSIVFNKDMVNKIFGFGSGSEPFVFTSDDPEVIKEVKAMRQKYKTNGGFTMSKLVSLLLADEEEVSFIRSFVMFFIATILCPTTSNNISPKYLFSLRDVSQLHNLDYGDLCLTHLLYEIDNWRDRVFGNDDVETFNKHRWIGGCLPVMAVVYLDFVDFTGYHAPINYGLPRIRHVTNADFEHLMNFDRKKSSPKSWGVLPFKDLSLTPYAHVAPIPHAASTDTDEHLDGEVPIDVPVQYYLDGMPLEVLRKLQSTRMASQTNQQKSTIMSTSHSAVVSPLGNGKAPIDISPLSARSSGPVTRSMFNAIPASKVSDPVEGLSGNGKATIDISPLSARSTGPGTTSMLNSFPQSKVNVPVDVISGNGKAPIDISPMSARSTGPGTTSMLNAISQTEFNVPVDGISVSATDKTNPESTMPPTTGQSSVQNRGFTVNYKVAAGRSRLSYRDDCGNPMPADDISLPSNTQPETEGGTTICQLPGQRVGSSKLQKKSAVTPTGSIRYDGVVFDLDDQSSTHGRILPGSTGIIMQTNPPCEPTTDHNKVDQSGNSVLRGNVIGDGLYNIAKGYADFSASPSTGLAEGFVTRNTVNDHTPVVPCNLQEPWHSPAPLADDTDVGINIALSYGDAYTSVDKTLGTPPFVHITNKGDASIQTTAGCTPMSVDGADEARTGPNTRDKRNRKKRAAKVLSPDITASKKLKIDADVDAFYTKFLRNKFFVTKKPDSSPVFIQYRDFHVDYDKYHDSFKARGYVSNETMAAYAELSNTDCNAFASHKQNCTKYTFSPYLAAKLIDDPSAFDKKSCVREIKRLKLQVKLSDIDLMHFPVIRDNHWVLACVNNLFKSINFFDSAGLTKNNVEKEIVENLTTNLFTVFQELNVPCFDFKQFKKYNPPSYPCQSTVYDCGVYLMLYIPNWTGKLMKDFSDGNILYNRMRLAFNMFNSTFNKIDMAKVEALKRKKASEK